ncbi:MAG: dTDP-glucose 4,6-dehydratase [Candidatus Diapherotrites archaeon]|uniref:dTDP-glucose 4,6-dehydratase n=1 Tax=Candidatus Iainarchaeum sp. TaxID=3101447 RepID=A0A2D6M017_9ARCH|nr:dTDP-glucose 4,6-dehydratase [Candidatus Diapherotrites archaeon]|tara:strand:+ start:488 stop:1447 length:960 start_codon:yes stop_codon:yes gene_type:complete
MKILITGGAGFIGSNYVRMHLEQNPSDQIVNLDKLTYAGRKESLVDIEGNENYEFIQGDICDAEAVEKAMKDCDTVINFAAESHVDRSLEDSRHFAESNFFGVRVLCEQAKKQGIEKFVQISTDEVYGQIKEGSFTEQSVARPRNPYSAAKAAGELLAMSYFETFELPVVVTRSSNNYGPYQFPEKVMPLFITNLMQGKKVPLYGEGLQIRDWLYVGDNCEGIKTVFEKGKLGEIYNIGGGNEIRNIDLTKMILEAMDKGEEMIEKVPDRIGHDFRYSLDCSKIEKELGWKPKKSFEEGLKETVDWYKNNEQWWKPLVK